MESHDDSEFPPAQPEAKSWSQDRRLKFIDFRLRWEGRVNRGALMTYFGISPPQASADFAAYSAAAPQNIDYAAAKKSYVRTAGFAPVYPRSGSQLYLNELLAVSSGILEPKASFIDWRPDVGIAPVPTRTFDGNTLALLVQAIREKRRVGVTYQGMVRPEPTARDLSPHALAFDGIRWHVRAYCHLRERYQDFVLGRVRDAQLGADSDRDGAGDDQWHRVLKLVLAPNPSLSPAAKRAIRLDYGMHDGMLELSCRQALLFYALRRLRLEDEAQESLPQQQVILVNRGELKPFIDDVHRKAG